MRQVYLQLHRDGRRCFGTCWEQGDQAHSANLEGIKLAPDDTISLRDPDPPYSERDYSLDDLVEALVRFQPHDLHVAYEERGQVTFGKHLFDQTLGRLDRFRTASEIDLRIITDDEHLARLPWPLLMRDAAFLSSNNWTFAIATQFDDLRRVELLPPPRLLMVAPEPASAGATKWHDHFGELKQLLERGGPQMVADDHLRCVNTWEDFQTAVRGAKWDVIYYYGHGVGDRNQSRLVFEAGGDRDRLERAMSDFADIIDTARRPPTIIYVNCCQGDAGGLVGAGRQLSRVAPCVVTNRTIAAIKAARAQARAFWEQVLLHGVSPHRAVARNYQQLGDIGLDRIKPYWFTPVLHANYSQWLSHPPKPVDRRDYDLHWKVRLDRVDQIARVEHLVQEMLFEKKPRTLAFVWYGQEGQGMQLFHDRLEVDLPRHIKGAEVISYRLRWPEISPVEGRPSVIHRGYEEKLWEAFEVDALDGIAPRVRTDAGYGSVVVVLNFPHVNSSADMDPPRLVDYLRWWDDYVTPKLEDANQHFVLAFSFRPKDCRRFERALDRFGYTTLELPHTVADRLPPLECVARDDLNKFLQRYNVYIPSQMKDKYLDLILQKSKGHYEATLRELEKAVIEGYAELAQQAAEGEGAADSDDDFGMD